MLTFDGTDMVGLYGSSSNAGITSLGFIYYSASRCGDFEDESKDVWVLWTCLGILALALAVGVGVWLGWWGAWVACRRG